MQMGRGAGDRVVRPFFIWEVGSNGRQSLRAHHLPA